MIEVLFKFASVNETYELRKACLQGIAGIFRARKNIGAPIKQYIQFLLEVYF